MKRQFVGALLLGYAKAAIAFGAIMLMFQGAPGPAHPCLLFCGATP